MTGPVKKAVAGARKAVTRQPAPAKTEQPTSVVEDLEDDDPPVKRAKRLGYDLPDSPPTVYSDGVTVAVPLDSGNPRPADET